MTTPAGNNGGDVPAVVVVSVAIIVVAAIGGVTFLVYAGRDTTAIVSILAVLSPFIVALLAVRNSRKIDDVRRKVDGKIDNLITDKANLEHQVSVAGLTPITATVSYDPDSTGPIQTVAGDVDIPETTPPTNPYHVADLLHRLAAEKQSGVHDHG